MYKFCLSLCKTHNNVLSLKGLEDRSCLLLYMYPKNGTVRRCVLAAKLIQEYRGYRLEKPA